MRKEREILPWSVGELGKFWKDPPQTPQLGNEVTSLRRGYGGSWEQPTSHALDPGLKGHGEVQILQRGRGVGTRLQRAQWGSFMNFPTCSCYHSNISRVCRSGRKEKKKGKNPEQQYSKQIRSLLRVINFNALRKVCGAGGGGE